MAPNTVTFWTLLSKSIIVQSLITFLLVGALVFMYVTERTVPEGLQTMAYTVLAFWMGSKVQYSIDATNEQHLQTWILRKETADASSAE